MYDHDAIIDPCARITAEVGQLVHAEPQQAAVGIFELLFALKLGKHAVAARQQFECIQLAHRHISHIRRPRKPHSVDAGRTKARLNFLEVDTCEIIPPKKPLTQRLELALAAVAGPHEKQRLFHSVAPNVRQTRAHELQKELCDRFITAGECMHVHVKYRRRRGLTRPAARNLYGGIHVR